MTQLSLIMINKKNIKLIIVFGSIILIVTILLKNRKNIILTKFGTTQWELYQSYYKYGISSKSRTNFQMVGVYELSWDGKCYYYIYNNRKKKLRRYEADDVITKKRGNTKMILLLCSMVQTIKHYFSIKIL